MIIGYGFGDDHINQSLLAAVRKGLRLFVNSPLGAGLAHSLRVGNPLLTKEQKNVEAIFKEGLIGASRRGIRDILINDEVERAKFTRFLGVT